MHPIGKIISGLILILVGLALYAMPQLQIVDWLGNFIVLVTGSIPILLIIIGLFVVWLEADELKVAKEFRKDDEEDSEEIKNAVEENPEPAKRGRKRGRKKKATNKPEENKETAVDEM